MYANIHSQAHEKSKWQDAIKWQKHNRSLQMYIHTYVIIKQTNTHTKRLLACLLQLLLTRHQNIHLKHSLERKVYAQQHQYLQLRNRALQWGHNKHHQYLQLRNRALQWGHNNNINIYNSRTEAYSGETRKIAFGSLLLLLRCSDTLLWLH